jgi:hypothetical protein
MVQVIDPAGTEQQIGGLALGVVAKARAKMEARQMGNAVEIQRPGEHLPAPHSEPMTPMAMLDRAISQGAGIEVLERLMTLQERYEKNEARKAFDEAISDAKAEIGPVVRNATGHNNKRYADFAAIARAVDPIISRHGLSYRFRTAQTDRINVTCILSHKAGHSEETTLGGPPDASGSKNAIQAIGSTLSYLQRYSLTQALGLASANDDDGATAGKNDDQLRTISADQVKVILKLLDETDSNVEKFCQMGKIAAVPEMLASQFDSAVQLLNQKKAKLSQRVAS